MRIIIGVDTQFVFHALKTIDPGNKRFPFREFHDFIAGDHDEVIEVFAPVIRFPPNSSQLEDIAAANSAFSKMAFALREQGVNVIEAPARLIRQTNEVKHSDDQRLMVRLALTCARLKPDFLVLVAADGDYAPLVWGLREEGIRTKLITDQQVLSPDLRNSVFSISDLNNVLTQITRNARAMD